MAAPFDSRRLAITGAAVPIIEGVRPSNFSFSSNGTLVYVPGSVQAVQHDSSGSIGREWKADRSARARLRLSEIFSRGTSVAVNIEEGDGQIGSTTLPATPRLVFTFEGANNIDPVWTPDGKRIAFKGAANRLFGSPPMGVALPKR